MSAKRPGEGHRLFTNSSGKSKYRAEFADQAYKYCLLGAKTADLAKLLNVSDQTIRRWLEEHDDFAIAVRDGGELADAEVAAKLFRRATGFSRLSRKVKRGPKGQEVTTESVYYPPDVAAAVWWLKNRQNDRWRDKQELTLNRETIDFSHLDAEQRQALREALTNAVQPEERGTLQ